MCALNTYSTWERTTDRNDSGEETQQKKTQHKKKKTMPHKKRGAEKLQWIDDNKHL